MDEGLGSAAVNLLFNTFFLEHIKRIKNTFMYIINMKQKYI